MLTFWHASMPELQAQRCQEGPLTRSAPLACDLSPRPFEQIPGPMQQNDPGIVASASYSHAQRKICSADSSLAPSVRYRSASVKRGHRSPDAALPPERRQELLAPPGGRARSTAPRDHALAVPFPALAPYAPGVASWIPVHV